MTSRFAIDYPSYSRIFELSELSNSTLELVHCANLVLKGIYRKSFRHNKSGMIVSDFC